MYVIREFFGSDITDELLRDLFNLDIAYQSADQARETFRQRLQRGIRTFAALLNHNIVGILSVWIEPDFHCGLIAHILNPIVNQEYKDCLLPLLERAQEFAIEAGVSALTIPRLEELTPNLFQKAPQIVNNETTTP